MIQFREFRGITRSFAPRSCRPRGACCGPNFRKRFRLLSKCFLGLMKPRKFFKNYNVISLSLPPPAKGSIENHQLGDCACVCVPRSNRLVKNKISKRDENGATGCGTSSAFAPFGATSFRRHSRLWKATEGAERLVDEREQDSGQSDVRRSCCSAPRETFFMFGIFFFHFHTIFFLFLFHPHTSHKRRERARERFQRSASDQVLVCRARPYTGRVAGDRVGVREPPSHIARNPSPSIQLQLTHSQRRTAISRSLREKKSNCFSRIKNTFSPGRHEKASENLSQRLHVERQNRKFYRKISVRRQAGSELSANFSSFFRCAERSFSFVRKSEEAKSRLRVFRGAEN